jgi:hypothetical protein
MLACRAAAVFVALTAFAPTPAHADLWCWLFNSGCGGGDGATSSQQTLPDRAAPEIDPGTFSGAIALAAGGAAMLSDRVRRRRR